MDPDDHTDEVTHPRKPGRPPIGDKPLTGKERARKCYWRKLGKEVEPSERGRGSEWLKKNASTIAVKRNAKRGRLGKRKTKPPTRGSRKI